MPQTMQVLDVLQGHSASVASRYKTELLLQPTLQPLEGKNSLCFPEQCYQCYPSYRKKRNTEKKASAFFFFKSFNCKLNSELIC